MRHVVFINEIKVGACGQVTYRLTDSEHAPTAPLAPELRSEAYYVWERSSLLRVYVTSSPMHPSDWEWGAAAWQPHAPIDDILASRGYEEPTPAELSEVA